MPTRQYLHQQALRREGKCIKCGSPAEKAARKGKFDTSPYCLRHQVNDREKKRRPDAKRNIGSPSYKRERGIGKEEVSE